MSTLARVCGALDGLGISHALIGAAALAAYGVARSTFDIDLLTADVRVLDRPTWQPLVDHGVAVEIRKGDADDPLGGVVRVSEASERPVDVIVGKHAWQARAVTRAQALPGGPRVVLARDLVLLKLYAGGPQDVWDVRQLLLQPDAEALIRDVTADVGLMGAEIRARWAEATILAS